jgi:hypothetical protein
MAGPVAGRVALIEPGAAGVWAHVEVGAGVPDRFLAWSDGGGIRAGEAAAAWLDCGQVYWFDGDSGQLLAE